MPEIKHLFGKDHVPVVAFDLDGTLNYHSAYNVPMINREINNHTKELMKKYKDVGYIVIIYTSRDISRKQETEIWLVANTTFREEHYDDIVFNKLKYDIIIDDKAVNPSCFLGALDLQPELHKEILRPRLICEEDDT